MRKPTLRQEKLIRLWFKCLEDIYPGAQGSRAGLEILDTLLILLGTFSKIGGGAPLDARIAILHRVAQILDVADAVDEKGALHKH